MTARDGLQALSAANHAFELRLRLAGTTDWQRATPCAAWDVRALANHVIGGNRRYLMLLRGASAAAVDRTRTEDHLGADPILAFATSAAELAAAFGEDGALAVVAHHPIGDRTGAELLAMRAVDLIVHAWDLARALHVDETLEADAVDFALAHLEVLEAGRHHGSFAAPIGTPPSTTTHQSKLLHLAGRFPEGDPS